jgi:hypothetical protein
LLKFNSTRRVIIGILVFFVIIGTVYELWIELSIYYRNVGKSRKLFEIENENEDNNEQKEKQSMKKKYLDDSN